MLLVLKLILILIHNMFLDHTIPILINLKKIARKERSRESEKINLSFWGFFGLLGLTFLLSSTSTSDMQIGSSPGVAVLASCSSFQL